MDLGETQFRKPPNALYIAWLIANILYLQPTHDWEDDPQVTFFFLAFNFDLHSSPMQVQSKRCDTQTQVVWPLA